jgi:hypothetical protein
MARLRLRSSFPSTIHRIHDIGQLKTARITIGKTETKVSFHAATKEGDIDIVEVVARTGNGYQCSAMCRGNARALVTLRTR